MPRDFQDDPAMKNAPSWSRLLSDQEDFQESQKVRSEAERRADARAAYLLALREMPEDIRELSVRMECEFLMREVWRAAWISGFRAAASGAGRCEIDAVRAA